MMTALKRFNQILVQASKTTTASRYIISRIQGKLNARCEMMHQTREDTQTNRDIRHNDLQKMNSFAITLTMSPAHDTR